MNAKDLREVIATRRKIEEQGPSHPDWYEGMEADTDAAEKGA